MISKLFVLLVAMCVLSPFTAFLSTPLTLTTSDTYKKVTSFDKCFVLRLSKRDGGKRKLWTSEDDALLKLLVHQHGRKWELIASIIGDDRSANSLILRWENHLNPNFTYGPFTSEEDEKLLRSYEKNKRFLQLWSCIQKESLPDRSVSQIRKRYMQIMKTNKKVNASEIHDYEVHDKILEHKQDEVDEDIKKESHNLKGDIRTPHSASTAIGYDTGLSVNYIDNSEEGSEEENDGEEFVDEVEAEGRVGLRGETRVSQREADEDEALEKLERMAIKKAVRRFHKYRPGRLKRIPYSVKGAKYM